MRDSDMQATRRNQEKTLESVQRLEILLWRFSEAETRSLSLLQLRHQRQPNALDMPLDECRLRFARWLVEQGRLSEGLEAGLEGQLIAADGLDGLRVEGQGGAETRVSLLGVSSGNQPAKPGIEKLRWAGGERWHLILFSAWSGIRRGMAKAAEVGRQVTSFVFIPEDGRSRGVYGAGDTSYRYGPFRPYGP